MTEFQKRVFTALKKIPEGRVSTYRHLADYLSCNSAQAIGQALKMNPDAPAVPCHRIIKTDLSIGGYYGETSGEKISKKRLLLAEEGVGFDDEGKLIDSAKLYDFTA